MSTKRFLARGAALTLLVPAVAVAAATGDVGAEDGLAEAVTTTREMVVTANPLATAVGERVLAGGGTAADAMVAVQAMLGLVEPQSSGIGGGAFAVYYDAKRKRLTTYDAREKAPAAATPEWFLDDEGERLGFIDAWQSGRSVGVPGVPKLMGDLHADHGRRAFFSLIAPAAMTAWQGFPLSERTSSQAARLDSFGFPQIWRDPTARAYFFNDDGTVKPAGTIVTNRDYARTLWMMGRNGADSFYRGRTARDIVGAVNGDLNRPAPMTRQDLRDYDIVKRDAVCVEYRSYEVCGMGPPSSGGLAVGQILGILDNFDVGAAPPTSAETVHLVTQASRLAFADRNRYVGDSDFVDVPIEGMLDPAYLAERAALIDLTQDLPALPGNPPGSFGALAADTTDTSNGTSHFSIVDRYGNALSMTTTVESSFGNGVMVGGFLLNNQLTDFSFAPVDDDGNAIANRVEGNKRPRSSMSPTIVFDQDGDVAYVTGSPGGSRIIGYTAQSIINMIDFGMDPQEAINTPHYVNRNGSTDLEEPLPGITGPDDVAAIQAELEALGHSVSVRSLTSGLSIIQVTDDGLIGGADMRRDGAVGGS